MKKVVLAFSGGLDTTYCATYLARDLNYKVFSVTVDTGGFSSDELRDISETAKSLGVTSHENISVTNQFYDQCLRYLLATNYLKNNTYPLSVSAERFFQAMTIAHYAKSVGADAIAHGSTGAGNDQVRFDAVFNILCPEMEIITPIRDKGLSRDQEISYLKASGIKRDWEKSTYSINKGIWGASIGGSETLTSDGVLPESAYPSQMEKSGNELIKIEFNQGNPCKLNGVHHEHPVTLIQELEKMAAPYAIGRDVHIGDTIIGIKGRVAFEAPAPLILIKAHHLLEKHVLTKTQQLVKDQIAQHYGNMVHEGQFLEPAMRDMEAAIANSQIHVTGEVQISLSPYRFQVLGVTSSFDLMNAGKAQYGETTGAWTGEDVKGFTKIYAHQAKIFHGVHQNEH
jgi:argininosuccinate synthase